MRISWGEFITFYLIVLVVLFFVLFRPFESEAFDHSLTATPYNDLNLPALIGGNLVWQSGNIPVRSFDMLVMSNNDYSNQFFLTGNGAGGGYNYWLYSAVRYGSFAITSNQDTIYTAQKQSFGNLSSQLQRKTQGTNPATFANISTKLANIETKVTNMYVYEMAFLFGLAGLLCGVLFWKIVIR